MAGKKKGRSSGAGPTQPTPSTAAIPCVTTPRQSNRGVMGIITALILVLVAGALYFLRTGRSLATHHEPVRDVILVTIDTTRADALGYAGNRNVRTPFLDSLAARGIAFMNAHAHNVITLPSHVNILTGLYPFQHGVHENAGFVLDAKYPTVATTLRTAGFATGAFVSAFPLDRRFGLSQGFDVYDDNYGKGQASVDFVEQERRGDATLDAAMRWWSANAGRKRFLWVHLYDPHAPYAPPEPFLSQYRSNEYLGEVAYVDSLLQQSLSPVLSADPNALVIVTADHGEALGDHGERTHGLFAYESTLKIPLLVAGAEAAHRIEKEYVRHVDIVPTILDATAVSPARPLPGHSLLQKLTPSDSYFESLSASLNRGWAPLTGIIHNRAKYIDLPLAELYDLPHDPGEIQNLRDSRRREVEEARKLLAPMLAASSTSSRSVSAEEIARLRSLGYVTGSASPRASYTAADDPKNLVALDAKMHDSIAAFERHEPGRALQLARELVAERPGMIGGREVLAFMLRQNDFLGEAMRELEIIVQDPNAGDDNRVQLALLYSESGQPGKAIALLGPRSKGTRDPDLINAYGVALSDDGKEAEARGEFQRVLTIDPVNAPALQNLGILELRRGDLQSARGFLERSLELNPRLPLALNSMGVVFARSNDLPRAVEAWNRAVAVDPRQYDALFNVGLVEGRAGHRDEARRALTRFVETAPRSQYAADIAAARQALASLR
jgi:choline-sulfatase